MGLKGVPKVLSPDLLHAMASMGHGDELILADVNFPADSICRGGGQAKLIPAHGVSIPDLLEAILQFFPLDTYNFNPVLCMALAPRDKNQGMQDPEIWDRYQNICDAAHGDRVNILMLERFDFYKRAKQSYAIVATGEDTLYSSVILRKGLVKQEHPPAMLQQEEPGMLADNGANDPSLWNDNSAKSLYLLSSLLPLVICAR